MQPDISVALPAPAIRPPHPQASPTLFRQDLAAPAAVLGPSSHPLQQSTGRKSTSTLSTHSTASNAGTAITSTGLRSPGQDPVGTAASTRQSLGSTSPASHMSRPASHTSLAGLRASGESSRSALPFGAGSFTGPTPRSSMETTGSNVQQPGFVRKRINHWMAKLTGRMSSKGSGSLPTPEALAERSSSPAALLSSSGSQPSTGPAGLKALAQYGASGPLSVGRGYVVADEGGVVASSSELHPVAEVAAAHVGPTSFPLGDGDGGGGEGTHNMRPATSGFITAGKRVACNCSSSDMAHK